MTIQPILRDDNGHPLFDRGSEIVTKRFTSVDAAGQNIVLDTDVKEVLIHVEGSIEAARFTGAAAGSEQIRLTSDGLTLSNVPIVAEANRTIITVAAPTDTIDVSVIGWR